MIKFGWEFSKGPSELKKATVLLSKKQSPCSSTSYARQFFDDEHAEEEDRFILLGMSHRSRIVVICHCEREAGDVIRISSARKATSKERKYYEGPSR